MLDTLIPLKLPPGLYRPGTVYSAKGRWYDAHLVRFRNGAIEPVGGWRRAADADGANLDAVTGMPRAALGWRADDGSSWVGIATTSNLYILAGGVLHDVTPSGFTAGDADGSFTSATGNYGDGTYGSGAYGVGPAGATFSDPDTWQLDTFGEDLAAVSTSDSLLYVWAGDVATVAAQPAWGPTFTGSLVTSGSTAADATSISLTATTLTGKILAGQTFTISGTTYTATASSMASSNVLAVSVTPSVPATIADATAVTGTDTQAPSCVAVVTTPERYLFALGADGVSRRVQWPDQETTTIWGVLATNTAGSFDLATNGALMAGRRTRGGTLLWTDLDVHLATWIGGTLVYRFDQVGDQCGLIAPNAVAMIDGRALWMGLKTFFLYDGYVKPIPCEVADFVFSDLNVEQRKKIWALPIAEFGEVWWFYPSAGSLEIDRYVAYSYEEDHWTIGALTRTAGTALGPASYPVLVDSDGVIWEHEVGFDYTDADSPFLESGPVELGNGDRVMHIMRIVPDEKTLGDTELTLYTANNPTDTEVAHGPYTPAQPTDVRLTARQVRLYFEEVNATGWRIGVPRLGVLPGSRR